MNTSRLRELVDLLLDRESKFKIQPILGELNTALTNLTNNFQDQNLQTQYATSLEKLRDALGQLVHTLTPAEMKEIAEIGAEPFFSHMMNTQIEGWVLENPISPAVAQKKVNELFTNRNAYVQTITQLRDNFSKLNIVPQQVEQGSAEIGFLIPRDLFKNELEELIKELGVINRILRAFSELATKSVPPIEVRGISTTDPLFFFGISPVTIALVGGVITWTLKQWETVEKIRQLRSETKKNDTFSDDEIKDFFDSKIEKTIESAVTQKVAELLKDRKDGPGRTREQEVDLTWALKSLLARVERGMTMEIRFLAAEPAADVTEQSTEASKAFSDLAKVVPELVFPPRDASPVLELPPPEPHQTPKAPPKSGA